MQGSRRGDGQRGAPIVPPSLIFCALPLVFGIVQRLVEGRCHGIFLQDRAAGRLSLLCVLVLGMSIAHARTISFAGQEWIVRSGTGGPGPNQWSDSAESVWVDRDGLHLKIRNIDGVWHCAEVTSERPTRYGVHRFYVASRIDLLDRNVVASPFLYKDDSHEVDIEFSRWQKMSGEDAQYVVQPSHDGNLHRFRSQLEQPFSTHSFDWQRDSIHFKSFVGHAEEPSEKPFFIQEWTYEGADNPAESEGLRIHINLWLIKGEPPSDRKEVEFLLKDADLPEVPAGPAHVTSDKVAGEE